MFVWLHIIIAVRRLERKNKHIVWYGVDLRMTIDKVRVTRV